MARKLIDISVPRETTFAGLSARYGPKSYSALQPQQTAADLIKFLSLG